MELLVVILIIGILVAIAIPSFLSQQTKAKDASAESLARTAETAAETYATDHNGWAGLSQAALQGIEATIPIAAGGNNAYLSDAESPAAPGTSTGTNSANTSYSVTVTSTDGNTYSIARNDAGALSFTCTASPNSSRAGSCTGGSW